MLRLVEITPELENIEFDILNSDAFFNRVSVSRDQLTREDVERDKREADQLGAERLLVADGSEYVGILDFLMENPNDGCPWLGLLQVDKRMQRQGYGRRMLELYMNVMRERGVERFRIGVIEENAPALRFWLGFGFNYVNTVVNDRQLSIRIYEKMIG